MDRSYDRERFGRRYEEEDRWMREPERGSDYARGRAPDHGYGGSWRGGEYDRGGDYGRGREFGYGTGGRGREDRGFFERASDEVRTWFGDEDAQRRRTMDERDYGESRWSSGQQTWRRPREQTWREQGHYGGFGAGPGTYGATAGQHFGRGPKGYVRSDDRVKEDVCERLSEHGEIDARDMEVTVRNGEVTLQGSVQSRWMKRMAEEAVENISGVKDVHNELRVTQQGASAESPIESRGWGRGRAA